MFMRHLILLAAACLCGCSAVPASPPHDARAHTVVRVLDGDTLVLDGEGVRLANVDAPELPPEARFWGEGALGVQAAAKAQDLVSHAARIELVREGHDRFGRTLARVTLNESRDLGDALVFAGVAARKGERAWDWCGPADFRLAGGPGFDTGPVANPRFMAWVSAEQLPALSPDVASLMLSNEDGEPLSPFF
ncbi:thermonuclease family protein [Phenylobacterium sp.]|uniref:thermonuclease family protein n=1 Tax=Phenylobacterium sp. TaxID=1871053 RepID=UPI00272A8027|nr:thermonuclease family protein [Phenylobacterium sp.]